MNKVDSKIVDLAISEDIGLKDVTSTLISSRSKSLAHIISKQNAIICGIPFVDAVFAKIDPKVKIHWFIQDSDKIRPQQVLCDIYGLSRSLLSGERTALNFLQTLSSTATLTHQFVKKIKSTKVKLLDTRKTLPGLRSAQKYAVRCGGGENHRFGLYDSILIKENHIAACGSITKAVTKSRNIYPKKSIEVEVRNLKELKEALVNPVDIVMLDNFPLNLIYSAVRINKGKVKLEISGGVNLENIFSFAKTGIDYISVGAITKTVMPIEFSMLIDGIV